MPIRLRCPRRQASRLDMPAGTLRMGADTCRRPGPLQSSSRAGPQRNAGRGGGGGRGSRAAGPSMATAAPPAASTTPAWAVSVWAASNGPAWRDFPWQAARTARARRARARGASAKGRAGRPVTLNHRTSVRVATLLIGFCSIRSQAGARPAKRHPRSPVWSSPCTTVHPLRGKPQNTLKVGARGCTWGDFVPFRPERATRRQGRKRAGRVPWFLVSSRESSISSPWSDHS